MSDLKELIDSLPRGGKLELAILLNVDQAKITKAKHGLVRDQDFNDRIREACNKILSKKTNLSKRKSKLKITSPNVG